MPQAVVNSQLENYLSVFTPLALLGEELVRAAQKVAAPKPRRKGATLRPGTRTPLWNAVVQLTLPHLAKRGEKARLARVLGVPPQRVHDYFVSRTQSPDAERTLLLLAWLAGRREEQTAS